jgi:hypothetical protein
MVKTPSYLTLGFLLLPIDALLLVPFAHRIPDFHADHPWHQLGILVGCVAGATALLSR